MGKPRGAQGGRPSDEPLDNNDGDRALFPCDRVTVILFYHDVEHR